MRIVVGNTLSFVAAAFTGLAAMSDTRKRVLVYQLFDCIFLGVAQIVFGVTSGAVSLFLGAARNIMALFGRYNLYTALCFTGATVILGLVSNKDGALGIVPIVASVILTVGIFFAKDLVSQKLVLFANLSMWSVYSFLIYDFATGVCNLVSAVICLITLIIYGICKITHRGCDTAKGKNGSGQPTS